MSVPRPVQLVLVCVVSWWFTHSAIQSGRYRDNAMDLCAWHARSIFNDDPNGKSQRWIEVRNGTRTCPFCGQVHDSKWVSRNGWESQLHAMVEKEKRSVRTTEGLRRLEN